MTWRKLKFAVFREAWRCQNVLLMIFNTKLEWFGVETLFDNFEKREGKESVLIKFCCYFCGLKVPKFKVSKLSNIVGFFKVWAYVACDIKCGYRLIRIDFWSRAANYLESKTLQTRLTISVWKIRKQMKYLWTAEIENNHALENELTRHWLRSNGTWCKVWRYTKLCCWSADQAVPCPRWTIGVYFYFSCVGSWRISDLSLTNSFATSSLLLCHRMRRIVQPVSSFGILLNNGSHRAQERWK